MTERDEHYIQFSVICSLLSHSTWAGALWVLLSVYIYVNSRFEANRKDVPHGEKCGCQFCIDAGYSTKKTK